ncbi:hypothetical protein GW835_00785 [archaeon]|nr:hypothetical protein [archaeon]NCP79090.1 hypothetical protein [archaeon]NCP97528.1 hypothetical protein [archaeon]NCQ06857.1 hypothetical protein [archaeon]NCQ50653.1 hypothetical protein [archaeon]
MHKIIKSSVKRVKKEIKNYLTKPKNPSIKKEIKGKDVPSLFNKGKEFVKNILRNKKSSKEYLSKNKSFFTKSNLKALLAYVFSDFSLEQIEDMIRYIFGDLAPAERENVLLDILDHINNKEYGFLLRD